MRIDLLVYTHSSCGDVFRIFLNQLSKFSSNDKNVRLVVLSDDFQATSKIIEGIISFDFIVVQYNDKDRYSNHFSGLHQILNEYFLYMQEDFFLVADWNLEELQVFCKLLQENDFSLIRLTPSGSFRSKAYLDYYLKPSKITLPVGEFRRVDYLSSLPACMQPTVWKSDVFLEMHSLLQIENLREEWSSGYRKYFREKGIIGLATPTTSIPYLEVTAVRKGKWNFTDFHWGVVLQEILKAEGVNPLERGISTYKFHVTENQSNILKDLWRRLRYGGF